MNFIRPQEPPHWVPPENEQAPFYWLTHLLSFLRRRWPIPTAAVVVAAMLGLTIALAWPPRYTAETDLLFDVRRADLLRQQTVTQDALTLNSVLESQVELLQSAGLARKTVERLGLTTGRQFVEGGQSPLDYIKGLLVRLRASGRSQPSTPMSRIDLAAQQLRGMLKVWRVGQTYVLAISITSPSAEEAAWLANGVADSYLADELQAKEAGIQQATGWLHVRLQELHDQAVTADRAVQDFKAAHHIVDTDRGLMGNQQLTELSSQLVAARAKAAAMLTKLQRIQTIMAAGVDGGAVTDGLDNKVIVGLRQQYVDDDRRATELAAKFGAEHSVVRALRAEMAEIKKSILGELGRIAATYQSDYNIAAADEVSVQQRLDQTVALVANTNNDLVELRSLQSSADTYRSLYQNFLQRYTQAVQDQSFPVPEARVITQALPPLRKSEPKTTILIVLFSVVGAVAGLAIAFMSEVLDRGIRSAADVRQATGFNCLAIVPRLSRSRSLFSVFRWRRGDLSTRGLVTGSGPAHRSAPDFADAIRTLRIRVINQRLRSGDMKVVGCMSSSEGAGASVIAVSLAQMLARAGGRTLLMDWDFVQASSSEAFGFGRAAGCSDVLTDRAALGSAIHDDQRAGISVMPVGTGRSSSVSLMTRHLERMQDIINQLRARYSFVVVDLPSLSSVADSHIAAHMLDAVIVVMEWGQAERDTLLEKLGRIGLDEVNVLGVVLNKAQSAGAKGRVDEIQNPASILIGS